MPRPMINLTATARNRAREYISSRTPIGYISNLPYPGRLDLTKHIDNMLQTKEGGRPHILEMTTAMRRNLNPLAVNVPLWVKSATSHTLFRSLALAGLPDTTACFARLINRLYLMGLIINTSRATLAHLNWLSIHDTLSENPDMFLYSPTFEEPRLTAMSDRCTPASIQWHRNVTSDWIESRGTLLSSERLLFTTDIDADSPEVQEQRKVKYLKRWNAHLGMSIVYADRAGHTSQLWVRNNAARIFEAVDNDFLNLPSYTRPIIQAGL